MDDQALVAALGQLENENRNGTCRFYLKNDCPQGWGVTIAVAGVNFYYKDGSSETDGPRAVQLTSGQSAVFASSKPAGCVKRSFLAMTVVVDGEGSQNMTHMSDDAGSNECYLQDGIILGPTNRVQEDQLDASRGALLQLRPLF